MTSVVLDTTLADLYRKAAERLKDKNIGQVLCGFSSAVALTPHVPRNWKYIYQDGPLIKGQTSQADAAATAVKFITLVAQRDGFISGNGPMALFHRNSSAEQQELGRRQVEETLAVLPDHQRPSLIYCDGPADIPIKDAGIDMVAFKGALDALDRYPTVVPLETHWFLNSKGALASSGLPTPASNAIKVEDPVTDPKSCCKICLGLESDDFIIPETCGGERGLWLAAQCSRLCDAIEERHLPFVLKTQQGFGGVGTYLVRTDDERQEVITTLQDGLLRRLLSTVSRANFHLHPATLLLSELVEDPVGDYGLTFFVNDSGRDPVLLGVSDQIIENGTSWIGSKIDYRRQDSLWEKFAPLAKQIAKWLQSHGYIGPVGADVLETREGSQYIVDLNVRTSGSLCLPLLTTHFTSRGLFAATSISLQVRQSKEEFKNRYKQELADGSLCIVSWCEDDSTGMTVADVVAGAKDETGLQEITERVQQISDHMELRGKQ